MNSHRIQLSKIAFPLLMGALMLLASACQKKCQPAATTNFKSVTAKQWRLVETTDPSPEFKKLTKTTFLIFTFDITYTGTVLKVLNNVKFNGPAQVFNYTIDPDSGKLRIEYKDPPAQTENQADAAPTDDAGVIVDYAYDLGKELELSDSKAGYYYRFLPYEGTINPDDTCEF